MSANAPLPPGPEFWQTQYLRLIAFTIEPAFEHSRNWWRDLTGLEPQTSTEKRPRQEREDSGPYDGAELSLAVDLLRVQWTAAMALDATNPPSAVPVIGPFLEKREWFRDLMGRWLGGLDRPIRRLALAGTLLVGVDNRRAAYERLNQYLRCVDLDPDSTDFLYRINRARPSNLGISGLVVNRLTTWAALVNTFHRQMFMPADPEMVQRASESSSSVMLELDINTSGDRREALPQDRLGEILAELADAALDVASRGDACP